MGVDSYIHCSLRGTFDVRCSGQISWLRLYEDIVGDLVGKCDFVIQYQKSASSCTLALWCSSFRCSFRCSC